jgi:hypothetical protein
LAGSSTNTSEPRRSPDQGHWPNCGIPQGSEAPVVRGNLAFRSQAGGAAEGHEVPGSAAPLRQWAALRRPRGCPGRAVRLGSAGSPSLGSPAPSARSAPRSAGPPAACRQGAERSSARRSADGASEAACPASPAGSSAAAWGAAWPGGQHRPAGPVQLGAWGSAAAAPPPPPPGAALATRHPCTPKNAPPAPSTRPGGGRSGRASAGSQTRDAASRPATAAGEPTGQPPMRRSSAACRTWRVRAGQAVCVESALFEQALFTQESELHLSGRST